MQDLGNPTAPAQVDSATQSVGLVDKHAAARSNVFVLGQLLKHEVERQAHKTTSRPGARVVPVSKPGVTDSGAAGLPVRQMLSSMYEIERQKRLGEVAVFFGLFAIFGIIAFQLYDVGGASSKRPTLPPAPHDCPRHAASRRLTSSLRPAAGPVVGARPLSSLPARE